MPEKSPLLTRLRDIWDKDRRRVVKIIALTLISGSIAMLLVMALWDTKRRTETCPQYGATNAGLRSGSICRDKNGYLFIPENETP